MNDIQRSGVDYSVSQAEFNAMCAEISRNRPQWELRYKNDLFGRESAYLYAVAQLQPTCASVDSDAFNRRCRDQGNCFKMESESLVDSDTDRVSSSNRRDGLPTFTNTADNAQSGAPDSDGLFVTYYVSYSECYALPQVHFWFDASELRSRDLTCFMPGVVVGIPEGTETSGCTRFIVSPSFCEELQMALWSVHQCDAVSVLDVCHVCEVKGSLVERFLRAIGTHIGLSPSLIP